jgi:hypothetical protein
MQVVFVHGVNNRDLGDGVYEQMTLGRKDRFNRLAFDQTASIRFPYWGKFGLAETSLLSIPTSKGETQALGTLISPGAQADSASIVAAAKRNFPAIVASLSVAALEAVSNSKSETERHAVEDFWMAAARYADARPVPSWLSSLRSDDELGQRLAGEVSASRRVESLGAGWLPKLPKFDPVAAVAGKARDIAAPYLAQFLGDAMMFFSRRNQSDQVRAEINGSILEAAKAARDSNEPLVLIGHSMGGSILHELLTDADNIDSIEHQLERPLKVDLFLGVGTQVGLFAELKQFQAPSSKGPLGVAVSHYWNIYDYADTLAFLSEPTIADVVDFEISTSAGLSTAHNAYFDNAFFFSRLNKRLKEAGLLA